ncbi:MAG: LysR family transcriptional regulator [Pseudomonadota bacterium]
MDTRGFPLDKWTELRTAYAVARLGTVSAAAKALGVNRATVIRHIDALEAELESRVFIRHAKGYALTETGEDVLDVAQKTTELIGSLASRTQRRKAQLEGEIFLSTLAPFVGMMSTAISEFKTQHPRCRVRVRVSEDLARLEHGEAHIALRSGTKPDHPDYVVADFGTIVVNLFAHESYVQRLGLPSGVEDFAGHFFVMPDAEDYRFPFVPWIRKHIEPEMIALSSNDILVNIEAVSKGVGIGFMGDHKARLQGNFHPVFPPEKAWHVQVWLVTHTDLHRTEKVQAMLENIRAAQRIDETS